MELYDFVYCCSTSKTLNWKEYCQDVNTMFYCMTAIVGANTCPTNVYHKTTTDEHTTTTIASVKMTKILQNQTKPRLSVNCISM